MAMQSNEQISPLATDQARRGMRKTLIGVVISDKMDKTVVVEVTRTYQHAQFKKSVRTKKRYKAHDEKNECKVGAKVLIEESRPISREKRWRVKTIL
jgi:small subunit ribosomal protein S17